jgi:hypothetical protein
MEPRPVLRQAKPGYPTRRDFLAIGASALTAASIAGCGDGASTSALVAPIFTHGEGRGATGCMALSPPVFLSEEEALQIVREEFAKAGITLGKGMPLPKVIVDYEDPNARWMRSSDDWLGEPSAIVSKPADLTAVDRQQGVGVAIMTRDDCNRFASGYWSTVASYDTKGLAESVANALREQAKEELCIGVFYDPLESLSFEDFMDAEPGEENSFERIRQSASDKSHARLRDQVQDFVAWLEKSR